MSNSETNNPDQTLSEKNFEDLIYGRIAENVRKFRKKQGESQEQFATSCHLDRTHVGYIEQGRRKPTIKTLIKIANYLDIDVVELIK